jgi:ribonuclease BN (tRNA processing enzyme)
MQGVKLVCFGSSSSGNSYLLDAGDEILLIEAGINMSNVIKYAHGRIKNIVGCLISHHHTDHSKHLRGVLKYGINVLAIEDVFEWHNIENRMLCKTIEPAHGYKVGNFKVYVLELKHANNDRTPCPCVGFIIQHFAMGKLLFVTDTMFFGKPSGDKFIKYSVPGINHIMLEANYSDEILDYNIDNGFVTGYERPRLLASHMELKTTAQTLQMLDTTQVQNVILLHLSSRNASPEEFRASIEKVVGMPVKIASPGLELNLSLTPY